MLTIKRIIKILDPNEIVGALIIAGILIVVGIILTRMVRYVLKEIIAHDVRERIDQITISFVSHLAIFFTWVVLLTIYAHIIPALHKIGTLLLTGVGLVSIIIGFAAQSTLGNLVSGVSLVLYKPFRRGDRLQVIAPQTDQYETGYVEDITLGFTILKTDDGRKIIIANSTMAQQTFIKHKRAEPAKEGKEQQLKKQE